MVVAGRRKIESEAHSVNLSEKEKEIILALADCDMNPTAVSRMLYMHRNTVLYHLQKIADKTSLEPKKFYDLVKLVEMASA